MKQSHLFVPTLRETPSEAGVRSHQLLVRAGYIRQIATGVYAYLPLAQRVIKKVTSVINEELARIGANEMQMPNLLPMDYWQDETCRRMSSSSLFSVSDRMHRKYMLAPSHENAFIELIKNEVQSYKRLPMKLYQVQMKYRDEKKPKFGLMYSREFLMTDFYSFHADSNQLSIAFSEFEASIKKILAAVGLTYHVVHGNDNRFGVESIKEIVVSCPFGDTQICLSNTGGYSANRDVAVSKYQGKKSHAVPLELEKIATKEIKSMESLAAFCEVPSSQIVKSYFFFIDHQPTLILIRGDHELNGEKVKKHFQDKVVSPATEEECRAYFATGFESIGPIHLPEGVRVIADYYVKDLVNMLCGGNEEGFHYKNANLTRDFTVAYFDDFHLVQDGEEAPDGEGVLHIEQGIKIGHFMTMSEKYSQSLSAYFVNENGKETPLRIGYCGLGVSRLLSLIVEQHCDEKKIQWPNRIAPFDAHIIPVDYQEKNQQQLADEMMIAMKEAGYEVLLDDRKERVGVKFADADLIGCPIRITIGKKASEGIVEMKLHQSGDSIEVRKAELVATLAILNQTNE